MVLRIHAYEIKDEGDAIQTVVLQMPSSFAGMEGRGFAAWHSSTDDPRENHGRPFCAFVHDCRDMAKPQPCLHESVKGTSLFQGAVPITEKLMNSPKAASESNPSVGSALPSGTTAPDPFLSAIFLTIGDHWPDSWRRC